MLACFVSRFHLIRKWLRCTFDTSVNTAFPLFNSKVLAWHILVHIRNNKHETENAWQAPFFATTKTLCYKYIFCQGERHAAIQATAPLTDDHLSVTGAFEENLCLDLLAANCWIGIHFKDPKLPRQAFCGAFCLRNRGTARILQNLKKI